MFPVPYDGAVDMVLLVDGKEYPAKLLDAKERPGEMYEDDRPQEQGPGPAGVDGHGLFKTGVFPVPAGAAARSRCATRSFAASEGRPTSFPLWHGQVHLRTRREVVIPGRIESQTDIKNVYSPTHDVEIKRPTTTQPRSPTPAQT